MADALGTPGGVVSALDHRLALAGLIAPHGAGLDVRTGVLAGPGTTTLVTGTSATGTMTVSVAAHHWVTTRGTADGVYLGTVEAATAVPIAAAPGANTRIDVVWVKQNDAASTLTPDGTTGMEVGVTTGIAAVSPTKPAIPVGALELATVTVAAGATSTDGAGVTISNTARQTVARGAPVPVRSQAERDALATFPGLEVYRLDTGQVQLYTAGAWATVYDPALRPVGKRVRKTGTDPVTNTWRTLPWEDGDPNDPGTAGMWGPGGVGTASIAAPARGLYAASAGVQNVTNLMIRKNSGGTSTGGTMLTASTGVPVGQHASCAASGFLMEAGDYVTVLVYSTTAQSGGTAGGYNAHFSLALLARL